MATINLSLVEVHRTLWWIPHRQTKSPEIIRPSLSS